MMTSKGPGPSRATGRTAAFVWVTLFLLSSAAIGQDPDATARASLERLAGGIEFVPNGGQWPDSVRFRARAPGVALWVCGDGLVYDFHRVVEVPYERPGPHAEPTRHREHSGARRLTAKGHTVKMRLAGGRLDGEVVTTQPREGRLNFFKGTDASRWVKDLTSWGQLRLEEVLPGIDLALLGDGGDLRYDFVVKPGATTAAIRMEFDGADRVRLAEDGALVLATSLGEIRHRRPVAFQVIDGERHEVPCRFRQHADGTIGFASGAYDPALPLTIDPTVWSTVIGGASDERFLRTVVDAQGRVFAAGESIASDFPVTSGAWSAGPNPISWDVVALRLGANGVRQWSTVMGGTGADYLWDLVLDPAGNPVLSGYTESSGFPTTPNAYSSSLSSVGFGGYGDGFVLRLSASGSSLLYSTYFGGAGGDSCRGLQVESSGTYVVTGFTGSPMLPTTGAAFSNNYPMNGGGYILRLSESVGMLYNTFIGGSNTDVPLHIDRGSGDVVYITGYTQSPNWPVTAGAFQTTHASPSGVGSGANDAFVTALSFSSGLVWSTFLGGGWDDRGRDLVVDAQGRVCVCGFSGGSTVTPLPTTAGSFDPTYNGSFDAFVATFSASGNLIWSTYLGGPSADRAEGLAVDGAGRIAVVGVTSSSTFPRTETSFLRGQSDAWSAQLDSSGSTLLYGRLRGGSGTDEAWGVDVTPSGELLIAGHTRSTPWPPGPFVSPWFAFGATRRYAPVLPGTGGIRDGFVVRESTGAPVIEASVGSLGVPCAPAGLEPVLIATEPVLGQAMAFAISGAAPSRPGVLFLGLNGFQVLGSSCIVWVDVASALQTVVATDANGFWASLLPLPASGALAGLSLRAQAAVTAPGGPVPGVHLSNALQLTLGL